MKPRFVDLVAPSRPDDKPLVLTRAEAEAMLNSPPNPAAARTLAEGLKMVREFERLGYCRFRLAPKEEPSP